MNRLEGDTILINVLINAPVKEVWNAWTKPDLVLGWFGSDPHGKGLEAQLDVRPGGSFEGALPMPIKQFTRAMGFIKKLSSLENYALPGAGRMSPA